MGTNRAIDDLEPKYIVSILLRKITGDARTTMRTLIAEWELIIDNPDDLYSYLRDQYLHKAGWKYLKQIVLNELPSKRKMEQNLRIQMKLYKIQTKLFNKFIKDVFYKDPIMRRVLLVTDHDMFIRLTNHIKGNFPHWKKHIVKRAAKPPSTLDEYITHLLEVASFNQRV